MDILQVITQELGVQKWQVEAAVKLIDEGNTIPFISRYRKEATGTLNDEQLRNLNEIRSTPVWICSKIKKLMHTTNTMTRAITKLNLVCMEFWTERLPFLSLI